jgi:hypothetical protein
MTTELFKTVYGSKLYGTSTPTSDTDEKVVYLPSFEDVLLGRKLQTYKKRFNADGSPLADDGTPMPDNGVETEYVPFQTFCRDYLNGQTYALEVVMAHCGKPGAPEWMVELNKDFTTCNVASMAGFAMKQTFDYVHRGRRLEKARQVLEVLEFWSATLDDLENMDPGSYMKKRLDTVLPEGEKLLHTVAREAGLELGTSVNNNRTMETLKLNGREYLETTDLKQLELAVSKLVNEYGDRSQRAAADKVDHKSLSHAVRVYEQALELLTVGKMSFPRLNVGYLLNVKQGKMDADEVKARLLELEEQVTEAQKGSTLLPAKTPELEARFDRWLINWLSELYDLS